MCVCPTYLWTHGEEHAARGQELDGAHERDHPEAAHGEQQLEGLEIERASEQRGRGEISTG